MLKLPNVRRSGRLLGILVTLGVASCSDGSGANGRSLIAIAEVAPGADCRFGGTRIDSGLDNGDGGETANDGVLGAGEIDSTRFICNGNDGGQRDNQIISLSDEPAGANCPAGGRRIDIGLDNGEGGGVAENRMLEPGEIDQTQFVCGARSTTGSLVELKDEPPGQNCAAGGTRIESGFDNGDGLGDPRDGVLHPDEIDSIRFVCTVGDPLFQIGEEPPGANCLSGGTRIEIGLDNGDGAGVAGDELLQPGEVDGVEYDCGGEILPMLKMMFDGNLIDEGFLALSTAQPRVGSFEGAGQVAYTTDRCNNPQGALAANAGAGFVHTPVVTYNSNVTYSLWVQTATRSGGLVAQDIDVGSLDHRQLLLDVEGKMEFSEITKNGVQSSTASQVYPNDPAWHHVVAVYDFVNRELLLYVDGVAGTAVQYDSNSLEIYDDGLDIGRAVPNNAGFSGSLDSLRVFDRELTAEEIAALFAYESGHCD